MTNNSVFKSCTKAEIDKVTNKALGILKSGRTNSLKEEKQNDGNSRKKNEIYRANFFTLEGRPLSNEEIKKLLIKYLRPDAIADVQIDERTEPWRANNKMYIYIIYPILCWVEKEMEYKEKVQTYLKIEMIQLKKQDKLVLLISLHEPEDKNLQPRYHMLKN